MSVSAGDVARRRLGEAADAAAEFRRLAGLPPDAEAPSTAWRVPAEASVRAALEAAHARAGELEQQLVEARRAAEAAAAENRVLAKSLESEAAGAADAERIRVRAAEVEARAVSLKERATLMEAEFVRLESLRRKAERDAADAEAAGHSVEESLRHELRKANAALDRAAVESGALEARAKSDGESLRARLDSATSRLQALERERRLEIARGSGDASAVQAELQRALAVAVALRQEAAAARAAADQREESLRHELIQARRVCDETRAALDVRAEELSRALAAAQPPPPLPAIDGDCGPSAAGEQVESAEAPVFTSPSVEPVLDPGWARLLRLVRPPVESAYAHLRRLSTTALTTGQKALLRMAAASIAQASDSLSSIELALEDGPASDDLPPVLPVVEASLAAWETPFRRRGVALVRELPSVLPEAVHEAKELRVLLYHALRNALEAVPRGGRLTVRSWRGPDGGLRLEFSDDGPGFPAEWLERRFEAFASPRRGHAGLGLSLIRRTMRRWGGDAEASNVPSGRGARLTMLFAPPTPSGPCAAI